MVLVGLVQCSKEGPLDGRAFLSSIDRVVDYQHGVA
jgi:hypothetical protein